MVARSRRFTAEYSSVISSQRWRHVRQAALARAHYRCEQCGKRARLDGHHWRGYSMLGREQPGDVRMLCRPCHDRAHGKLKRGHFTFRMMVTIGLVIFLVYWVLNQHA